MSKITMCILIFLSFILIGCSWQSEQVNRYPDTIKNWNGHHIDDLIYKWGYPQQSFKTPNGNNVYVYSRETIYISPIWTTPITNYKLYGGKTSTRYCNTYFETNQNKTIVKGRYEGNACQ